MKPISTKLRDKFKKVRLLALDVDGVLTDGGVYIGDEGSEFRRFDIKDGQGLKRAMEAGIRVTILSSSPCPSVLHRAKQLGIIDVFIDVKDKLECLKDLCQQYNITLDEVCFIGDDLADQEVMKTIGLPCTPADAIEKVKGIAAYVAKQSGGHGAVREVCDRLLLRR